MQVVAMKRVTLLLVVVLSVAGALTGVAEAARSSKTAIVRQPDLDREILDRINAVRESHGLRELKMSTDLRNAATYHSLSMLEEGYFEHDSKDGTPFVVRLKRFYSAAGYDSWMAGENLVYNSAAMTAADAVRAWLGSPAHRENMLDPAWRETGIASAHASSAGGTFRGDPTWVVTMDFGARSGKTTTLAKPRAAEKKRPAAAPERTKPVKKPKERKPAPPQDAVIRQIPVPALPDAVEQSINDTDPPVDDPNGASGTPVPDEEQAAGSEDTGGEDDVPADDSGDVDDIAFNPRFAR